MRFLGTCAADGMPDPFCSCPICRDARSDPAHKRFRSMFRLDERNLIDCGPDFNAACMRFDQDMTPLENIFITHTHEDHCCFSNIGLLKMSMTRETVPLDVFLSEEGYDMLMKLREALGETFRYFDAVRSLDSGLVRLHPVKPFVPFHRDGYEIMAVKTTHRVSEGETAVNYLFEKDGRKLLYACDTGYYPPQTLEALRGKKIDTLVMECTWGSRTDTSTATHLNCEAFVNMLEILLREQIIRPDTAIYATHINHKHDLNHDAMQAWFDANSPMKVTVAWDGLSI